MGIINEHSDNILVKLTFEFAVNIIRFCELLETEKRFVLARQLVRSGTSIGACVREAQSPESRADFIHKLKVASKEAEETEYWLLICREIGNYQELNELLEKLMSIKRILGKIIVTAKKSK